MKNNNPTLDPFAKDVFGSVGAAAGRARKSNRTSKQPETPAVSFTPDWHRGLPRVTEQQAFISAGISKLPRAISLAAISEVLSRYTRVAADLVSVTRIDLREVDRSELRLEPAGPRVVAEFTIGVTDAPLLVEADPAFAADLVDLMLGGNGLVAASLRELSRIEHAVVEFLCLMLCRELNESLGAPLLRLQGLSSVPYANRDSESLRPDDAAESRLLIASFHARAGQASGIVRIRCANAALSGLNEAVTRRENGGERIRRFATLAPDLALSIAIGQTDVPAADITGLECGDVVILSQPSVRRSDGRFIGRLRVRVGDGEKTFISGRVSEDVTSERVTLDQKSRAAGQELSMMIDIISVDHAVASAGIQSMEDRMRAEETSGEGAAVLDGLLLTLHVELAARRIGLNQLAQLRTGQIIELGCSANDPVDLLVDGRVIARGELVDIEGRLGVRITQAPG